MGGVLLFLCLSLVLGALAAPYVFNAILGIARAWPQLEGLRDVEFEKVASRCVLFAVVVCLIPALKLSGLASLEKLGFRKGEPWLRQLGMGWVLGMLSMLSLVIAGWVTGAYTPLTRPGAGTFANLFAFAVGALVVGYLEEPIFRGALFGMMRRGFGLVCGAMIASVLFAAVHFAAPEPPVGVVYGHWYSGLLMIRHMFTPVDLRWSFGFMFVTLFLIGMVLCLLYERFGSLYFAIGLHSGWVLVMRAGDLFFERSRDRLLVLFGPSMTVPKGAASVLLALVFLVVVALLPAKRGRGEAQRGAA